MDLPHGIIECAFTPENELLHLINMDNSSCVENLEITLPGMAEKAELAAPDRLKIRALKTFGTFKLKGDFSLPD